MIRRYDTMRTTFYAEIAGLFHNLYTLIFPVYKVFPFHNSGHRRYFPVMLSLSQAVFPYCKKSPLLYIPLLLHQIVSHIPSSAHHVHLHKLIP